MKIIILVLMLCCAFSSQQVDEYNTKLSEIETATNCEVIFPNRLYDGTEISLAYTKHAENMEEISAYLEHEEEQEEILKSLIERRNKMRENMN